MKTHYNLMTRAFSSATLAAAIMLALTPASQAKDKGQGGGNKGNSNKGHGGESKGHGDDKGHGNEDKHQKADHKQEQKFEQKFEQKSDHKASHGDQDKLVYLAHPGSKFVLSPGNGYKGRGYYYGPPHSPYYYQRPDVQYFADRNQFPPGFAYQPNNQDLADDAAVQRALARLGYYQGPIDGRIGPQSQRAISQYQQASGMSITNSIVPALLQALGLQ